MLSHPNPMLPVVFLTVVLAVAPAPTLSAAKKKPVETMDAAAIEFDPEEEGEPANRVREIELNLPPERKKGRILEGSASEAVASLAQLLRDEEKVI